MKNSFLWLCPSFESGFLFRFREFKSQIIILFNRTIQLGSWVKLKPVSLKLVNNDKLRGKDGFVIVLNIGKIRAKCHSIVYMHLSRGMHWSELACECIKVIDDCDENSARYRFKKGGLIKQW